PMCRARELFRRGGDFLGLTLHVADQSTELLEHAVEAALQKAQFIRITTLGARRQITELRVTDLIASVTNASNELRCDRDDPPGDDEQEGTRRRRPQRPC